MKYVVIALLPIVLCLNPAPAGAEEPSSTFVATPALLNSLLKSPRNGRPSTYEDFLAIAVRPVRIFDLNGDGLGREEIDGLRAVREQVFRSGSISRYMPYDMNNDQQITWEEVDLSSRIGLAANVHAAMPRKMFDIADSNKDGVVTLQEMLVLRPNEEAIVTSELEKITGVTIDIDPTPATNFTLDDARVLVDGLFAAYDTNKDGVLEPGEQQAALGS